MKTDSCVGESRDKAAAERRNNARPAQAAWTGLAVFLATGATVIGQGTPGQPADARDEIIRQLQQRLERVELEMRELKNGQKRSDTNSPASSMLDISDTRTDAEGEYPETRSRYPNLQFHGFGDFSYVVNDRHGEHNSFGIGHLDFFLNSSLSENMEVLSELVAETGRDNDVKFEIERLLLRYTPGDYLSLGMGRYHTAVGFYNTEYHHGTLFQTAVGRPFIYDFEDAGGVLPMHNVGITANGRIPSGSLGLQYVIELGNGRAYSNSGGEPVLNVSDDNSFKAVNVGLSARPESLPGLQIGFSGYYDRLTPEALPRVNQTVLAGYVVYQRPKFEWLNELLWIHHNTDGDGPTTHAWSAYSQIAQQFGAFRPYLRYQYLHAPRADIIFSNFSETGTLHGPSLGLRYDINDLATLKLQYDHYWQSRGNFGRSTLNQVTTQVGFGF